MREYLRTHELLPGLLHDEALWDDLVDRLAVYDVTYLAGGSADKGQESPYHTADQVKIHDLISDLARAPEPRLRDALIALLLRHPEFAPAVEAMDEELPPGDPLHDEVIARLLAAAALQRVWSFVLPLYLPGQPLIDVEGLIADLDMPNPEEEGGEALLREAGRVLEEHFPFDWTGGWEDAAEHLLAELRLAALRRPVGVE